MQAKRECLMGGKSGKTSSLLFTYVTGWEGSHCLTAVNVRMMYLFYIGKGHSSEYSLVFLVVISQQIETKQLLAA